MPETNTTEEKLSQHPMYFDPTGDIVLQAGRILFRVHQDVLSEHSEVFKDMFSLAGTGDAAGLSTALSDNDERLVLYDNPDDLTLLLAFVYGDPINHENTKQCLRLILLAHKYDMSNLVIICKNWIYSQLPVDNTIDDCEAVSKYREDRTLIPLTLRIAQLVDMPDITTWPLYMLSVQPDSDYRLFIQSEGDRLLVQSYSGTIRKLRDMHPKLIDWWEEIVCDFLGGDCGAYVDECIRSGIYRLEYGDVDDSMFMVKSEERDPIQKMWNTPEDPYSAGLCTSCEEVWTDSVIEFMESTFEDIRNVAHGS